jgi:hypothetical protein
MRFLPKISLGFLWSRKTAFSGFSLFVPFTGFGPKKGRF